MVKNSIMDSNSILSRDFDYIALKSLTDTERHVLVEKHLISPDLSERPETAAVLINKSQQISIMINEEDHIRMQSIFPGCQLEKAWELLSKVDDIIEESVEYCYDEQLGYITSCPTNVGTGMRASMMMHLPGLVATNYINTILQTISKVGLTARGLYGEGSEATGDIYQISNQLPGSVRRKLSAILILQFVDGNEKEPGSFAQSTGFNLKTAYGVHWAY